jgi:mRNA interferase MazF
MRKGNPCGGKGNCRGRDVLGVGGMARILRGEIRWGNLNPTMGHEQAGLRPVIILSKDVFNERMGIVIAVALTTKQPKFGFPLTFELESRKLPKKSWVLIGQIRTLSVERIGKKIADAGYEELNNIIEGLNEIIGT